MKSMQLLMKSKLFFVLCECKYRVRSFWGDEREHMNQFREINFKITCNFLVHSLSVKWIN